MKPTWVLIYCVGAVLVVSLAVSDPWIWQILFGIIVLVAVCDGFAVSRLRKFNVQRQVPTAVAIDSTAEAELSVSHQHKVRIKIAVTDHFPPELGAEEANEAAWFGVGETHSFRFSFNPKVRGNHTVESMGLLVRSPLALWWKRYRMDVASTVRVYPDFAAIARYLSLLVDHRTATIGMRQLQRRGAGMEFQQLRDYRQGDALNWIDWNATSKRRQLISRDFQDERNQTLIFLLDTGRRLRSKDDDLTHFDHSLNAMMLLGFIALRQGDAVGVLCFGSVDRWIPPVSGVSSMKAILNSVFDLDSGPATSDYVEMAEQLERHHRKRAMTILLTNIREEDYELQAALRLLRKRHFLMVANLRESSLDQLQDQPVRSFEDALASVGATNYLHDREILQKRCAKNCDLLLDSKPQDLHVKLSNAYWAVKRAGKL